MFHPSTGHVSGTHWTTQTQRSNHTPRSQLRRHACSAWRSELREGGWRPGVSILVYCKDRSTVWAAKIKITE